MRMCVNVCVSEFAGKGGGLVRACACGCGWACSYPDSIPFMSALCVSERESERERARASERERECVCV
jgi:hypothetical protein